MGLALISESVSEEQTRQLIAIELHQSGNPLVEGWQKEGTVCSSVGGFNNQTLTRSDNHSKQAIEVDRNLLHTDTFSGYAMPGLTISGSIDDNHLNSDYIKSTTKDDAGKVVETRNTKITGHLFSADTVDTDVRDATGKLKETIHSDFTGYAGLSHFDTIVKDAAGHKLRELSSDYNSHIVAPDQICTRLK